MPTRREADREREAVALLKDAGYVVLDPATVAGLHERIAQAEAQAPSVDSHKRALNLARVVGYLEVRLGPPARPDTD